MCIVHRRFYGRYNISPSHLRYNLVRESIEETRQACQLLQDRVFTPCLENVPEYFEHSARSMLDGVWCVNPTIDVEANLWWCRYLADVPGYIYSEKDRILLQRKLKQQLGGKPLDTGIIKIILLEIFTQRQLTPN